MTLIRNVFESKVPFLVVFSRGCPAKHTQVCGLRLAERWVVNANEVPTALIHTPTFVQDRFSRIK